MLPGRPYRNSHTHTVEEGEAGISQYTLKETAMRGHRKRRTPGYQIIVLSLSLRLTFRLLPHVYGALTPLSNDSNDYSSWNLLVGVGRKV